MNEEYFRHMFDTSSDHVFVNALRTETIRDYESTYQINRALNSVLEEIGFDRIDDHFVSVYTKLYGEKDPEKIHQMIEDDHRPYLSKIKTRLEFTDFNLKVSYLEDEGFNVDDNWIRRGTYFEDNCGGPCEWVVAYRENTVNQDDKRLFINR